MMIDIAIAGLIVAAVILAIRKLVKDKASGKGCAGCSGCSSAEGCPHSSVTDGAGVPPAHHS